MNIYETTALIDVDWSEGNDMGLEQEEMLYRSSASPQ
jgi:hypothetical protein